jgi:hypothetical protein
VSDLTFDSALGWLVVGLINDHFPHPDDEEEDPELGTAGCIARCGPCGALHYIATYQYRRRLLEASIRLTGFQVGGWCYWDEAANQLRWDWFEGYWARHKGCAVSNGVVEPCKLEEAVTS